MSSFAPGNAYKNQNDPIMNTEARYANFLNGNGSKMSTGTFSVADAGSQQAVAVSSANLLKKSTSEIFVGIRNNAVKQRNLNHTNSLVRDKSSHLTTEPQNDTTSLDQPL